MKIAIIGTGAMGSIYAARLAEAGHTVWAVDKWREHVEVINEIGLRVDGPDGEFFVKTVRATQHLTEAGACDLYIIATKTNAVAAAAQDIAKNLGTQSLVLTIQNGLGAGDKIAQYLPAGQIMLGVAEAFGATMKSPGHVQHTSMKKIRLGAMNSGLDQRLDEVANVWRTGGFEVETYRDIAQLIWEKLLCNVALSGPCTVFDCNVAELRSNSEWWQIALGCMAEAFSVGKSKGIAFSFDDPVAYVTAFADRVGVAKPSMVQDHHKGQPSEIDSINGSIPPLGASLGIPTPYNNTITALVKAREAAFEGAGP